MSDEPARDAIEPVASKGSGIGPDGEWTPAFPGQRRPFEPGNTLRVRHGAYATSIDLGERAQEIADEIRPTLPLYHPTDAIALALLGVTLTRIERATKPLEEVDAALGEKGLAAYMGENADRLGRLREDVRQWIGTALRLMRELGMTPASRAKLGLDLARTGDELERYLAERERDLERNAKEAGE